MAYRFADRALYVAGIYESNDLSVDLTSKAALLPGLRRCVKDHPPLSLVVERQDTEKPTYVAPRVTTLDDHIEFLPVAEENLASIEEISPSLLDSNFAQGAPPWKIVVLPLLSAVDTNPKKCLVAFTFSHALGDGMSGLAFHKSFYAGLLNSETTSDEDKVITGAMPPPFDTAKNLPISWSYLLAPALGVYLPKFVANALGFRAAVSTVSSTTWVGNDAVFYNTGDHRTGAKLVTIEGESVAKLTEACRKHDTKLTSFLHQIILHALSVSISPDSDVDNFASQTAINMRHHVNTSNDTMGLYVTGYFDTHARSGSLDMNQMWANCREMNRKLHACANTLNDQAIGLLRYLPSMRSWTSGKIGSRRDNSYELSNLLAFDPGVEEGKRTWSLGNMVFAQPANVTGGALAFNIVAFECGMTKMKS